MKKRTIVYCDDQDRFRHQFVERHKSHYDIILVDDGRDLTNTLERLKDLPDLVLLDLYHPRCDDEDTTGKIALAEQKLAELDAKIEETNQAVLDAWEPSGLDLLKLIRQKYSTQKLPVAIYTQKGLMLLDDNELREAELNGADWLIKKKLSARTEEIIIDRIIMRTPLKISKDTEKRYRWVLALSWLFIGLLLARMVFSSTQFADISIAVVSALVTGILSYLLAPLISKFGDKE